jgi:hypothetical protein
VARWSCDWRAERFGQLIGIRTDQAYAKWEAEPYVLGGGERSYRPASSDPRFNVGGDLLYDFTPNLQGTVSIRTDFAQVEADQEVINFTRVPDVLSGQRGLLPAGCRLFNVGLEQEMLMFLQPPDRPVRRAGSADSGAASSPVVWARTRSA